MMADWRQIQARIRKAKASTDAAAELAELYERTRDAMVAFELARWQEKAGEHAEAARWYTAAAERFRRSQWKSKAEAALARLRAPTPGAAEPAQETTAPQDASGAANSKSAVASPSEVPAEFQRPRMRSDVPEALDESEIGTDVAGTRLEVAGESGQRAENGGTAMGEIVGVEEQGAGPVRKPRRRGRRGGRNRRHTGKRTTSGAAVVPSHVRAENSHIQTPPEKPARGPSMPAQPVPELNAPVDTAASAVVPPMAAWRARSRTGEPALASRMAHLESQLRRLLVCPQAKLDVAESAPAGPGVLLLSDSDQVTHYYVESCQTLRIAIGNLVRGGRGAKDMPRLKERLAENLGIAESRVTNYLKEHCAVRWLQLDEGAPELAHFAIAVLRPVVNE
jgi:hypothetical protein